MRRLIALGFGLAVALPVMAVLSITVLAGGLAMSDSSHNLCVSGGVPQAGSTTRPETLEVVARALAVAQQHNASDRVMLATIMAIEVESRFDPTLTEQESDRDSSGALQQRRHWVPLELRPPEWDAALPGALGWVPEDPRVNLEWAVANFLDPEVDGIRGALYWDRELPSIVTPGQIAQQTQVSAFPHRYDQVRDRTENLIAQAASLIEEDGSVIPTNELCVFAAPEAPITDGVACPVGEPHNFTDTWGAPRSGGRSHQGVDIFADVGIPIYAYQGGSIRLSNNSLGGISAHITNSWGRFYYAHMSNYAPGLETGMEVETGQVIGFNGNSGNARYTPPHLHWEVRPFVSGSYRAVNPTPYASAACSGG